MESLPVRAVRRLALARAGLAPRAWSGLPDRARGSGPTARAAAHEVIGRFGYLQVDSVCVAGARSHALVLLSRLRGMDAALGESLLVPGAPLVEYVGHEACWMPLSLWPAFAFRREAFRRSPRWSRFLRAHRRTADGILRRARDDGAFRASDLEGRRGPGGWWDWKESKLVADGLWRIGLLAVRERRGFQKVYDLAERALPAEVREAEVPAHDAIRALILLALDGHGWADASTVAATWRLRRTRPEFRDALRSLADEGAVVACALEGPDGERRPGWIRPRDLEHASALRRWRPREDEGVLLSPFDPLMWDRGRVRTLFGFRQVLEIYVPPPKRRFGYFCLPVLAGERIVARVDLKAERDAGRVRLRALHYEGDGRGSAADRAAVASAVARFADSLGLAAPRVG
jgi:uncharacterized protein YcaQ